jgi:peptide/nickel transport system substrate-binding protein
MKRIFTGVLALIGIALVLDSHNLVWAQKYGGTLTLGMIADILKLDPHRQTGNPTNQVLSLITESLLELNEKGDISPGLAESWKASPDAREWTFTLRKGVMFHNGRELAADDVKKSYDHIRDPKTNSPKLSDFEMIKRIDAVDKYTVRFILDGPVAGFGASYFGGNAPIIPPETFDKDLPVGTGPFEFVEWKPRQYLKARRFKNYWRKGLPYADEIIFRPITDDTVRYTALRAGDIDFAFSLPFAEVPSILKKAPEGIVPAVKQGDRWFYLNLHTQRGALKDVRVRQAIAHALDKKAIMDGLTWGLATPEAQPFPPGSQWYLPIKDPYAKPDLAKARKLLEEAGHGKGISLIAIVRNETLIMNLATLAQAQLKKVGVDLKLEVMDRATHQSRQRKNDFDVNPGHLGFYPDPDRNFYNYNHSSDPNNYGLYKSAEYDKLVDEGRKTADNAKRKEIYRKAVEVMNRDLHFIYLGHLPVAQAWRSHVKNMKTNIRGDIAFHNGGVAYAWIEK